MSSTEPFCRGDVVLVAFPYVTDPSRAKHRPAVIIQNDIGNRFSPNLIVAGITSQLPRRRYPTDFWVDLGSEEGRAAGLDRAAVVKADTILTVPKSAVAARLGHFPATAMAAIDQCLRISLALQADGVLPPDGE
ncbi:MAG: type II toxin-antitoxin system PemK/MazF family toxin [Armatimonadetes bacterium]|jgi:mRNA interferase MazF|nr:type II toxin-antitoxin system PemK/MazF family toxin [Armatimonadota bacterium]